MKSQTDLEINKTGMESAKNFANPMLDNTKAPPGSPGGPETANSERSFYVKESGPLGTVPVPTNFTGVADPVLQHLDEARARMVVDKLGERLAYERSGVRFYDLMIAKCKAHGEVHSELLKTLQQNRDDEAAHMNFLLGLMRRLGADPTAVTPEADVVAVLGKGPMQILSDPRTTIAQGMDAMLNLETVDLPCWELLAQLARNVGITNEDPNFQKAIEDERRHLLVVRHWIEAFVLGGGAVSGAESSAAAQTV